MMKFSSVAVLALLFAGIACDQAAPDSLEAPRSGSSADSIPTRPRTADSGYGSVIPEDSVPAGQPSAVAEEIPEAVRRDDPEPPSSPAAAEAEPAAPATTDQASTILLRAERAYAAARSLQADFIQDLTVPLLASSQRSRGDIFHRKPDRFLMRFSDPAGDVVVADGTHVWLYYPSSDPKQVIRTSIGEAGRLDLQREFLSNPTERFSATLHGTENVDGRPAHVLTLVPRTASPYRQVRIWVDARDALVRRFEITENNEAVRRVELRNLRTNVELGDQLFSFTPPAGAQVFDQ